MLRSGSDHRSSAPRGRILAPDHRRARPGGFVLPPTPARRPRAVEFVPAGARPRLPDASFCLRRSRADLEPQNFVPAGARPRVADASLCLRASIADLEGQNFCPPTSRRPWALRATRAWIGSELFERDVPFHSRREFARFLADIVDGTVAIGSARARGGSDCALCRGAVHREAARATARVGRRSVSLRPQREMV